MKEGSDVERTGIGMHRLSCVVSFEGRYIVKREEMIDDTHSQN